MYYLAAEIASTVTAYRVTYEANLGGMSFDEIGVYSTVSPGEPIPATTTGESTGVAAEVAVSVREDLFVITVVPLQDVPFPPSPYLHSSLLKLTNSIA